MVATAAPVLRLSNSWLVTRWERGPPALEAYNAGVRSASVSVEQGVSWLAVSIGAPGSCTDTAFPGPCVRVQFQLNTAALAPRTFIAQVTISDPHAIDAPQVVMVTVHAGPPDPVSVDRILAPGGSADAPVFPGDGTFCFAARGCPGVSASTQGWRHVAFDCGLPAGHDPLLLSYMIRWRRLPVWRRRVSRVARAGRGRPRDTRSCG